MFVLLLSNLLLEKCSFLPEKFIMGKLENNRVLIVDTFPISNYHLQLSTYSFLVQTLPHILTIMKLTWLHLKTCQIYRFEIFLHVILKIFQFGFEEEGFCAINLYSCKKTIALLKLSFINLVIIVIDYDDDLKRLLCPDTGPCRAIFQVLRLCRGHLHRHTVCQDFPPDAFILNFI